jgi:hypothetical protein
METVQVTRDQINAALEVANDETKTVLKILFGEKEKPTLSNYKTIKTYEDACKALGETEHDFTGLTKDVVAYMKLKTISRALWGESFKPIPDATGDKTHYYPWFVLYTQDEIDRMNDVDRESIWFGALLAAYALNGAGAGFGCLSTNARSSHAAADHGFRLCQETEEKAKYFGRQFIELWAYYLLFNI